MYGSVTLVDSPAGAAADLGESSTWVALRPAQAATPSPVQRVEDVRQAAQVASSEELATAHAPKLDWTTPALPRSVAGVAARLAAAAPRARYEEVLHSIDRELSDARYE